MARRFGKISYIIILSLLLFLLLWHHHNMGAPPPRCPAPLDHVFFLKTHKCGSSTVQNVLMRRGFGRGLDFVLPDIDNYLGYPSLFDPDRDIAPALLQPRPFHVMTHHLRLHAGNVRKVMAGDARWVTVVREPASLFESLYNFYTLTDQNQGCNFTCLLGRNLTDIRDLFKVTKGRFMDKIGVNQMAYDFGMDPSDFGSTNKTRSLIDQLDRDFDLVMLCEHMEASLVLLADLMCWPLEVVTFIRMNARPKYDHVRMSEKDVQKMNELNNVDSKIYSHFKQKFKLRVLEYGVERMGKDVMKLMQINDKLFEECVATDFVLNRNPKKKSYPLVTYKLRDNATLHCRLLTLDEIEFTDLIRKKQVYQFETLKKLKNLIES